MKNFLERCKANYQSAPRHINSAEAMAAWCNQRRYVGVTGNTGGFDLPVVDVWQRKDDGWFSVRVIQDMGIYVFDLDLVPRDRDSLFANEVDWDWEEEERIRREVERWDTVGEM